jgi:hypothetical protein
MRGRRGAGLVVDELDPHPVSTATATPAAPRPVTALARLLRPMRSVMSKIS